MESATPSGTPVRRNYRRAASELACSGIALLNVALANMEKNGTLESMKKISFRIIALWISFAGAALAQKGSIAILDIDEVARVLKVDQAVMFELKGLEQDLNSQLSQHRQDMQAQLASAEEKAGQDRTPEAQQQLLDFDRKLKSDFELLKNQASQQLNALRVEKINRFRRELEPIARQAAKSNGFEVVITKTPQVFVFPEEVDITMEVVERARAAGMEAKVEDKVPVGSAPEPPAAEEKKEQPKAPQEIKAGSAAKPAAEPGSAPAPAPAEKKKAEQSPRE